MFIERLAERFDFNEPIFTEELLKLFSDYSRVQVFRMITEAKEKKQIIQYAKGVYYMPLKTRLGYSTITADDVVRKKYLKTADGVQGVYSGIKLLNFFSATTQMAGVVEIVTNNESAKYREIEVNNRRYILRKARCEITNENVGAYTVMQFFSDLDKDEQLDESSTRKLKEYIKKKKISSSDIFAMAKVFPARATKLLIGSGLLNGIV